MTVLQAAKSKGIYRCVLCTDEYIFDVPLFTGPGTWYPGTNRTPGTFVLVPGTLCIIIHSWGVPGTRYLQVAVILLN